MAVDAEGEGEETETRGTEMIGHKISYYDRLTKEEASRQWQQRAVRRALLKTIAGAQANEAISGIQANEVVAERGSGLIWVKRSVIAEVDRAGILSWKEPALTALGVTSSSLQELMAEEAAKK